ncbi:Ldh family oxidoreductase [Rhodobacteraceae bacterium NNCM2]|nr:Ldh family oxidoreductase [Coraliihabitans acroporae]
MTRLITADDARDLAASALIRCKTGPKQAESVADALVEAELIGQDGHGLRRMLTYAPQVLTGKIDGEAIPEAKRVRPGVLAINAQYGFAYPAIDIAVKELPDMTKANGVAIAGIRASHHAGAVGIFVERLAREGLVTIMMVNTPAAIAPWNGGKPLYGTNPIAFAAPVPWAEPMVIDMSLSHVARGKIMAAQQKGEPIPEGWAFDADGNPTTDPAAALKGTMVPSGGVKGAMLALMVEIIAAALTGSNFGFEATSFFEAEGAAPGTGQVIIAIDPGAIGAQGLARIGVMATAIQGQASARLPGRRRQQLRAKRIMSGFEIDETLLEKIEQLGK